MPVTFPDSPSTLEGDFNDNQDPILLAHTVTSGTSHLLVWLAGRLNSATVTWDGDTLTQLGPPIDAGGNVKLGLYVLANPSVTSGNISITNASGTVWWLVSAVNVHGGDGIGGVVTDTLTSGTSLDIDITAVDEAGDMAIVGFGTGPTNDGSTGLSPLTGTTELYELSHSGSSSSAARFAMGYDEAAGAGTITLGFQKDGGSGKNIAILGAVIEEAVAGGTDATVDAVVADATADVPAAPGRAITIAPGPADSSTDTPAPGFSSGPQSATVVATPADSVADFAAAPGRAVTLLAGPAEAIVDLAPAEIRLTGLVELTAPPADALAGAGEVAIELVEHIALTLVDGAVTDLPTAPGPRTFLLVGPVLEWVADVPVPSVEIIGTGDVTVIPGAAPAAADAPPPQVDAVQSGSLIQPGPADATADAPAPGVFVVSASATIEPAPADWVADLGPVFAFTGTSLPVFARTRSREADADSASREATMRSESREQ